MKIILTGGGSGGHFYPIIAVVEAIEKTVREEHLLDPKFYYLSTEPYDRKLLHDHNISFVQVPAGKVRRYFSISNFLDPFKTLFGIIKAIWTVFSIYPDVVFSKGGYSSFPAVFAARLLRIPVFIHESDSYPGRVNRWAGKFARRVAVSFPEAAKHFPKGRVALTGNPVRKDLIRPLKSEAHEYLGLAKDVPTIFILGGSQGAQMINDVVVSALPKLVLKYQVIHQTGENNIENVRQTSRIALEVSQHKERYRPYAYLNALSMKMAAGVADLVISRSGSTIFEIAAWGVPSIMIPIAESNGNHQRKNAYSYASTGAAEVIEETNLTANVLLSVIERLMADPQKRDEMSLKAKEFFDKDAAFKIAREIINIYIEHQD